MIYFFMLIFPSCFFAVEEMEVQLKTESSLVPIYLSKITQVDKKFSDDYAERLWKVLKFDFSYSGFFSLLGNETSKEERLKGENVQECFDKNFWQQAQASYVIKLAIHQKKIQVQYFSLFGEGYKRFLDMELTGDLSQDRKKMHQLTDAFVKEITGNSGVFSCRLLYAVRLPKPENNKEWYSEIWMSDFDGENACLVTGRGDYAIHPIFFPQNPSLCLYVSYKTGQPKFYVYSFKDKKGYPFLSLRGNQLLPSFSPRGDKLAFICDAAGRPDVFIQKIDSRGNPVGKPYQVFSAVQATQASPVFSPDGDKLAFVSDKDGTPRIYVIKVPEEGAGKRPIAQLITKKNRQNVTPTWSSDGTKLAYSAKTEGERQIWIYDFSLDEEWQLTRGAGDKENPRWAPDGLHIIFNTEENNSAELYLANIHQPEAVKITTGIGKKRFPSWEPLR
jgi:TolB protein